MDNVDEIFKSLCVPEKSTQRHAMERLHNYVISRGSMAPSTSSSEWQEGVGKNLLTLVNSKTFSQMRGAILAIDVILEIIKEDPLDHRRNLFRFYNHLTTILRETRDTSILDGASRSLGRLAQISGTVLGDHFVEEQIPSFFEMAYSDAVSPFGAVLALRELARHNAPSFFPHVSDVCDSVLVFLRNAQSNVRHATAQLLGYLLVAMGTRELQSNQIIIMKLIVQVAHGLESNSVPVLHGSLLALHEFFLYADKKFIADKFLEVCEAVLRFRVHGDRAVRTAVIEMIPILARYDRQVFCDQFFNKSMSFLVERLDSPDGSKAYLAIGHLSTSLKMELFPFVDPIFQHVKSALQMHTRQTPVLLDKMFEAIGLLARSMGPAITHVINDHLELVFACKLSEPLIRMLEIVVQHISALLGVIQERLLDVLSIILSGRHYHAQGSPKPSVEAIKLSVPNLTNQQVTLALKVLGNFDFKGHLLNEFITTAVIPHLDDDEASTRKAAALSTCRLLSKDPIRFQSSRHAIDVLTRSLDKLLSVGVVDSDASVRQTVLSALEISLDYQLARAEYVRLLMIALHDEVVDNRILAVKVIGRLASHNPGDVLPPLRKTLIRLLTVLKCSVSSQSKEDAMRILSALLKSTHTVVEQHIVEILDVLIDRGEDPSAVVVAEVLFCLGQLTAVGTGDVVNRHVPKIMPIVLASLTRSTQLRSAALDCLGHLSTNVGYVIVPMEHYPQLLPLLHGMLRREQSPNVRLQVIRVIGLLGALDPVRYQVRIQAGVIMESPPESINAVRDKEFKVQPSVTPDDPHQERVVELLLSILQRKSLGSHHHLVIDALITIAKTCGIQFAPTVPTIMPTFCTTIRDAIPSLQHYYLGQLTFLVGAIRQHIRTCVNDIIELVHYLWDILSQRLTLVVLVEALADALASEFGPYVIVLVPKLLSILQEDKTDNLAPTQVKVLGALIAFGSNLQDYMNLVVPAVITCYEYSGTPRVLRTQAIQSLTELSHTVDLYPYTSRIVHSLLPLMTDNDQSLHPVVVDALHTFIYTLGSGMTIFIPVLVKALNNSSNAQRLREAFAKVLDGHPLPPLERAPYIVEAPPTLSNRSPNSHLLKRAWDVSRVSDNHDAWIAWFTRLAAQLAKESPSISLRSCMNLFDIYPDISTQLFNPALASCWGELTEPFQEDFVQSIQHVMSSPSVPPEVAHYMLDLVEYMERTETPLPLSHASMADYCFRLQAYAKALHHRELQFFRDFAPSTIEALIDTNVMLRQGDAALGTLNLARQHYDVLNLGSWYEKLGQWNDALPLYEEKENALDPPDVAHDIHFTGKLRCLHALGEWEQLTAITRQKWPHSDRHLQSLLAPLGAVGAWHTGAPLETYYLAMESNSGDRAFYSAVSSIQQNRLSRAFSYIWTARNLLDPELTSLLDESPDRLDRFAVQAQMISELEEVVLYKQLADHPERQQRLRETWKRRLDGCQRDLNVWQRILRVRSLAIKPEEDIETFVRFANLCRKSGRLAAAKRVLDSLVDSGAHKFAPPPRIVYAQLKLLWAKGDRVDAFSSLHEYIQKLSQDTKPDSLSEAKTIAHILARCHLKHGSWQSEIDGGLTSANADSILNSYNLAKEHDPTWSRAWHTWALSNMEITRISPASEATEVPTRHTCHLVAAIEGFFRSLGLMGQNTLQDALSLLTLWFKFGAQSAVTTAMLKGFKGVNFDLWLSVVPQIIARIQTPIPIIREALISLLVDIGREHPQALVYPLTVGAKSPSLPRKMAALKILAQISSHSVTLVEQAKLVARELSRIAISWGEYWCEAIQASGRHFFSGNSKEFLESLRPLYDLLHDPCTPFELQFKGTFGHALEEARALCRRHLTAGDKDAFEKGWHIYLRVFHQINPHRPEFQAPTRQGSSKILDLHSVSPQLLHAVNMELAMPGTYSSGYPITRIAGFKQRAIVLSSKQRPRQLTITGDNGQRYVYLLKGREDLRQDERVMQVFGLVNTLLAKDRECLDRRLHLQRYPVIPLAPDVGLIGWMAGTDPLQNLIIEYRKSQKILPDLEHRMILQEEPEYDAEQPPIPLARRLQVFESVMDRTTGQDLYRILWLKSDSSEAWVSRRTTYTRSLAVSNMICYLLGVGDRHPGNIVLDRTAGKVIHIDFGDCFEVSFERDHLPEIVPFRLTRMMRHAMEVCGIQGGFKTSCEISMTVLRGHRESLIAVLEALVHDPLINWRLLQAESVVPPEVTGSLGSTHGGPNRRAFLNEAEILDDSAATGPNPEVRNERALAVCSRVEAKLTGRDFDTDQPLSVPAQVERLIQQATSNENLCQHFQGWCPFW